MDQLDEWAADWLTRRAGETVGLQQLIGELAAASGSSRSRAGLAIYAAYDSGWFRIERDYRLTITPPKG